jgi:DNA invertase Pin-like site-specific DNA recombinase
VVENASGARRVVIYGRVSLDRGNTKSVDDQLAELRQWAGREDWHVVGEYRDDGISASRFANGRARPGWQRAMDDIEARRIDALLVWDFSRASRDDKVTAALKAACVEHGVQIGYGGMLRDPATSDGSFYVGLDGLIAAKYSAELSEKTLRGKATSAAEGKPAGTVPYGYRRKLDPDTGKAVGREKHPDQAPVVEEIVRRLLARESADAIAADLTRRGILTSTGKPWRGSNLMKMALRPTYAGLRLYQGQVLDHVRGQWPAIIDEEDHHLLVAMHRDPARDKFRNPTHVKHLGSGIYGCGRDCDGVMRVVVHHGRRPNHYDCRKCHKLSRDQAKVDAFVEELMWRRLARPDILELLAEDDDSPAQEAAAEARRLRLKLDDVRRRVAADELSLDDLSHFRARWGPRIHELEEQARPRAIPRVVFDVAGPDAEQKWKALDIRDKRAILAAVAEVTILPVGSGHWQFDPRAVRVEWRGGT